MSHFNTQRKKNEQSHSLALYIPNPNCNTKPCEPLLTTAVHCTFFNEYSQRSLEERGYYCTIRSSFPIWIIAVWNTCGVNLQMKLERIQNYPMRLITSAKLRTPSAQLQSELSWMTLQDRREMQVVSKVHSCLHGRAPAYLCSKF